MKHSTILSTVNENKRLQLIQSQLQLMMDLHILQDNAHQTNNIEIERIFNDVGNIAKLSKWVVKKNYPNFTEYEILPAKVINTSHDV